MAGGNSILELKYHILNGRLTQAAVGFAVLFIF